MDWVLRSPQIHSTFSNLGYAHKDGYHINENCNDALEEILHNISAEDKCLRAYRRNISFGQNIKKDLIPLLISAKEDTTIELLIEIFVNLTTPIECLFNLEDVSKSDFGRHTIFEINNLLTAAKTALTDNRTTKVIIEFLKKNSEWEQKTKLPVKQCRNIGNTLLFLRNIVHIPEEVKIVNPNYKAPLHPLQNQILWNLFSHSIDKLLIKLMTIPDSWNWSVTMVQLVALLYKDQHVTTLHKLLNSWLESSLSDSSEDNESNTSPPGRASADSSPMLTSDPTSDSSDTGGNGTSNGATNMASNTWQGSEASPDQNSNPAKHLPTDYANVEDQSEEPVAAKKQKLNNHDSSVESKGTDNTSPNTSTQTENKTSVADNSDCGYGTQKENQESISTSSNEEELSFKQPMHRKPHVNNKQRPSINKSNIKKSNTTIAPQERKRKKIVKRGNSHIINVQGLTHSKPSDDEISGVLKEFTVDFLLKGFNALVKTLHDQILSNEGLEIDTSHFFWLITYFLKFATQIELDLEHVSSVLSFDIVSYLIAEGVNICEQFELAIKLDGNDLKPCSRRQHLVVTAIREFVQAIEVYKKSTNISEKDQQTLTELQMKMCETEELRSVLVLFLRCYNPSYHSKQYLQDLIVTNHILLMFVDGLMKLPEYKGTGNMTDHVKQFAHPDMMQQYGLLLEEYEVNGEFVNDCVFTVMHHVAGELGSLLSLFQPGIIKTFTAIWKSDFGLCDDWSDLVECVINTFVKKPHKLQNHMPKHTSFRLDTECFDEDDVTMIGGTPVTGPARTRKPVAKNKRDGHSVKNKSVSSRRSIKERWSEDELSSLNWNYMQCNTLPDVVGGIVKLFKEDGIKKSRESVIRELLKQSLITKDVFDNLMKLESENHSDVYSRRKEMRDNDIRKLCDQIANDNKSKFLIWVQNVLLEICFEKICLEKKKGAIIKTVTKEEGDVEGTENSSLSMLSPVSYHSLLFHQSVPLVSWNYEQAAICKDLKFLQLCHKLGFHMPVDTGKVFIRIPQFWTADLLYEIAAKIAPIDTTKLKFSVNDISESISNNLDEQASGKTSMDVTKDTETSASSDNFYRVQKRTHLANIANFTPMPGSSFMSYDNEVNKSNWLEVVQKSQDLNLNLNRIVVSGYDDDVEMAAEPELGTSKNVSPEGLMSRCPRPDLPLSMPTIMSVKLETDNYITDLDLDCNNSVCDTASVASDLTRMYVSDEDDKSVDEPPSPLDSPFEMSLHPGITDKRPRVHFTLPYMSPPHTVSHY